MADDESAQVLSRRERERLAHRREILEAAERVFARNGYHGATVEQIAQEAEFGVGTLYTFFKSKEELYKEVLAGIIEEAMALARERVFTQEDPVAAIEALIEFRLTILEKHKGFARVVFEAAQAEYADASLALPSRCMALIEEGQEAFTRIIERGVATGAFVNVAPADLTLCIQGILNAFIAQWVRHEPAETLAERVARLRGVILSLVLRRQS